MILADTSVWIDHLRAGDADLVVLLNEGRVCTHPMVLGELACGHLKNRSQVLELLDNLPKANEATHSEAMLFLEKNNLMGNGIGWVDVNLLAAAALTSGCTVWTRDMRLLEAAKRLRLSIN